MNKNTRLIFFALALAVMMLTFCVGASAEEATDLDSVPVTPNEIVIDTDVEEPTKTDSEHIFEDIYSAIETNADKIFSVLAFLGTLIVSIGYKSGFLPLLKDALTKLKSSIDNARENSDKNDADTAEKIDTIKASIKEIEGNIEKIESQVEGYDKLCRERAAMKVILSSQVDMLYAIFISSALPQYQKDEIGVKIQEMREELKSYEDVE